MENILKALHDHFYCQPELMTQEAKIKANHQLLRQRLSKRNRKMVLRIMDDKDLICSDVSLDSFICGFRLAWQIVHSGIIRMVWPVTITPSTGTLPAHLP